MTASGNESRAEECTSGTKQIHSGIAELAGNQAGPRTRDSVRDVQEGNEATHRAATIGRQHTLERLDAERWENQRAPQSGDERSAQRHQLIWRAPQHGLADGLDDERPQ